MRRIGLLVCVAVALVAAGCGSSNSGSSKTATAASTSAASSSGGAVAIKMQNIQFDPKAVSVKVGQKVTWTNDDSVAHNVTAQSGASFKSSNFNQGSTYSFTPTTAGTIKYTCTIHPGMNGTLTVTK